jgi:hypothetical protein
MIPTFSPTGSSHNGNTAHRLGSCVIGQGSPVDLQALHAKIGQLTLENDFLGNALNKAGLLSAKR